MAKFVTLRCEGLEPLRSVNPMLVSSNVEMTEVTGGTFWKAYTEAQVDGIEEFLPPDPRDMGNLHQWYDPIDTTNPRLLKLAKAIGPAWIRVSGTWANKTYYDFEDKYPAGTAPEGYQNVLKKHQWNNLLDFVKAVGGKLQISFANCEGNHHAHEPWDTAQAKLIMDYSRDYGVPVEAVEFTNEPNILTYTGLPAGYTTEHFGRDHDIMTKFIRENYPGVLIVGPCCVGEVTIGPTDEATGGGMYKMVSSDDMMEHTTEPIDVFCYHYYNGVSERGAAMGNNHWDFSQILTEKYLAKVSKHTEYYCPLRDKHAPGAQIWVTEAGDAGCGGNTWASTYADVPRTLNELGCFSYATDGVIFHNTLASSDYGWLKHGTFVPRPNYFAVKLWNQLMGTTVYDCGEEIREGAHVFCHSRRDGKDGCVYLIINNSEEITAVELPKAAEVYALTGNGKLRSRTMLLNGNELVLGESDELPELSGRPVCAGTMEVAPGGCTFIVL